MLRLAILALTAVGFASSVQAAPIYQPTAVTASTSDFGDPFALANMINQSGLSAAYTSGVSDFATVVAGTTHDGVLASNSGFSVGPFGSFSFDMGAILALDGFAFWATENSGSVTNFDLYADSDFLTGNGLGTFLGNFTTLADGGAASPAQVGSFGSVSTQYFHLMIQTTDGGAQPGIGEIAFRSAVPQQVPEPASLLLLGGGLVAVVATRRRKLR
jgi:hypothetical protein